MSVHLQREIERLKKQILSLCAFVEENVQLAGQAIRKRDAGIAAQVQERDANVDAREVEVEEECLKILALHQPVATDLRFVISILKINNDLERIGDLAVNLAHKAFFLAQEPEPPVEVDFSAMIAKTCSMLHRSLDSLVNLDSDLARQVCLDDDEVDNMKRACRDKAIYSMEQFPAAARVNYAILGIARNLERIADLATNISEDVIYMIEGEIVRHSGSE